MSVFGATMTREDCMALRFGSKDSPRMIYGWRARVWRAVERGKQRPLSAIRPLRKSASLTGQLPLVRATRRRKTASVASPSASCSGLTLHRPSSQLTDVQRRPVAGIRVRGGQSLRQRAKGPTVSFEISPLKEPKGTSAPERTVNLGPLVKESGFPAKTFIPDPKLEAALARLEEGFRRSGGG